MAGATPILLKASEYIWGVGFTEQDLVSPHEGVDEPQQPCLSKNRFNHGGI
jgi:hypothetical protein